jgi:FixJ family two-component response regulator
MSLRLALRGLIRSYGFKVSDHDSAEDFLASDDLDETACIVTDIHMPGMSGIDLKRHLVVSNRSVPVIMITARDEPKLLDHARASGAHCILHKPFEAEALLSCIETALGTNI